MRVSSKFFPLFSRSGLIIGCLTLAVSLFFEISISYGNNEIRNNALKLLQGARVARKTVQRGSGTTAKPLTKASNEPKGTSVAVPPDTRVRRGSKASEDKPNEGFARKPAGTAVKRRPVSEDEKIKAIADEIYKAILRKRIKFAKENAKTAGFYYSSSSGTVYSDDLTAINIFHKENGSHIDSASACEEIIEITNHKGIGEKEASLTLSCLLKNHDDDVFATAELLFKFKKEEKNNGIKCDKEEEILKYVKANKDNFVDKPEKKEEYAKKCMGKAPEAKQFAFNGFPRPYSRHFTPQKIEFITQKKIASFQEKYPNTNFITRDAKGSGSNKDIIERGDGRVVSGFGDGG